MKKFLVMGVVALLCGLGAVSCGSDAPFDAVLVMPTLIAPSDQACDAGVGYPNVQVKVETADGLPVPGATVSITPIGIGGVTTIYSDLALLDPLASSIGPVFLVQMTTDDSGSVYVNVGTTFGGAPTTTFTATLGFTATISGDQKSVTVTSSVSC